MGPDIRDTNDHEDGLLTVLANRRRRMLIRLIDVKPLSPRDAANCIAAVETDNPTSAQRHAVYVALRQTHVPTCIKHDVLEMDDENQLHPAGLWDVTREILHHCDDVLS